MANKEYTKEVTLDRLGRLSLKPFMHDLKLDSLHDIVFTVDRERRTIRLQKGRPSCVICHSMEYLTYLASRQLYVCNNCIHGSTSLCDTFTIRRSIDELLRVVVPQEFRQAILTKNPELDIQGKSDRERKVLLTVNKEEQYAELSDFPQCLLCFQPLEHTGLCPECAHVLMNTPQQ